MSTTATESAAALNAKAAAARIAQGIRPAGGALRREVTRARSGQVRITRYPRRERDQVR